MTTHSHTSFVANYDGSILSQYNTYMHSHPKEGEQGYSEADWNAWRQMHSEGDGIICDFGVYTVSDGKAKSYSYDVRYNHPDKSHWGNNCMTEVSVVAPKESQASFSARWKARWYMLRRQEERAPSRGRACSIEGKSVLRRGVRLEALRIRHTVCLPLSPEKGAEEPLGPNQIQPRNQDARNFNL